MMINTLLRAGAGAALLVVMLAGCTEDPPSTSSPSSPASSAPAVTSPAAPTPSTTPTAGSTPSATTKPTATSGSSGFEGVQLVKSGGIAGITETTTIKPDGTWQSGTTKGKDRSGKLSAADLAKLTELTADPRLAAEGKRPWPTRITCNDTFTYLLIVDYQMIKYAACPSLGEAPPVTKEIISVVQKATS